MQVGSQQWIVASLATGAAALTTLLLAVSTNHWLYMAEKCYRMFPVGNTTLRLNITMYTNFGILQLCTRTITGPDNSEYAVCIESGISKGIDKHTERDDSQWKTGTVIEATRIQFPLTCLAVILTLCGFVCSVLGNFRRDKRTIFAAVLYISSGLCLSVSVILFISRLNDELSFQQPTNCSYFHYTYGWSFYLIGMSFVMEETSAVISVKLYLMRNSTRPSDIIKIIPGLEEKFHIGPDETQITTVDADNQTLIW